MKYCNLMCDFMSKNHVNTKTIINKQLTQLKIYDLFTYL